MSNENIHGTTIEEKTQIFMDRKITQRKNEIVAKLYKESGATTREEKKEKRQDETFQKEVETTLLQDSEYQSYISGSYLNTPQGQEKLSRFIQSYDSKAQQAEIKAAQREQAKIKLQNQLKGLHIWQEWKEKHPIDQLVSEAAYRASETMESDVKLALQTQKIYYQRLEYNELRRFSEFVEDEINIDTIDEFVDTLFDDPINWLCYVSSYDSPYEVSGCLYEEVLNDQELRCIVETLKELEFDPEDIMQKCIYQEDEAYISLSTDEIYECLRQNPHYTELFNTLNQRKRQEQMLHKQVLEHIPEHIPDLFPLAREMFRTFILHVGPTNSGKTYNAIEALKKAEKGIYLAPLRLMAYEVYETLTNAGIPCSMITGEEEILTPGAKVCAMTIELADLSEKYDVAVIDEAQMLADQDRGGAWTTAILGIAARQIHICTAPEAENLILSLIALCQDNDEIQRYTRKTELALWPDRVHFPKDVAGGDACIVFSKSKVIACAAELQAAGKKCSIIYGDLPYETRHNEVRKFTEGETDVIVSTDAIGMGMNIPIHRIVFLETSKYDGRQSRTLTASEIKQIAGRAGRFGKFNVGYYAAEFGVPQIQKCMEEEIPQLKIAYLGFPKNLLDVDGKLSDIIRQWLALPNHALFKKQNLENMFWAAEYCEERTDDKQLVYSFATVPFSHENHELWTLFCNVFNQVANGKRLDIAKYMNTSNDLKQFGDDLRVLEDEYKRMDLLYNLFRKYGGQEDLEIILARKKQINVRLTEILAKQALKPRKCKYCGRVLKWNYPYRMCQKCHDEMYTGYKDDDFDYYGF